MPFAPARSPLRPNTDATTSPPAGAVRSAPAPFGCRSARVRNEHPDHSILPGRKEQLAVARPADMQIHSRDAGTHRLVDELAHRHTDAVAARVSHVKLDFFDGCYCLRDAVIG